MTSHWNLPSVPIQHHPSVAGGGMTMSGGKTNNKNYVQGVSIASIRPLHVLIVILKQFVCSLTVYNYYTNKYMYSQSLLYK